MPTKPRFYIASRLENAENVRKLRDQLTELGAIITYDWTVTGSVVGDVGQIEAVAMAEVRGVLDAHCVIVLLPGGRGTHVELGIAIAADIPVVLAAQGNELFQPTAETSAFYHLPYLRRTTNDRETLAAVRELLAI